MRTGATFGAERADAALSLRKEIGRTTEFACALGDVVRHAEDLPGLFVQQKVIVPKMATCHVPVEVLGFQIKHEDVGEELAKVGRDSGNRVGEEVAGLTVAHQSSFDERTGGPLLSA